MSQKRITKDGVYYHVTNHFHQGVIRFIDSKCKKMFIELCHKAKKKFNFKIKNLKKLAEHFGLIKSGGSDFHFAGGYRQARLGFFGEKKNIPDDILKDIMRRKK